MEKEESNRKVKGRPVIDMSDCSDCESCLSTSPTVFIRNKETGLIEVMEMEEYPRDEVLEAMNCCPEDCIEWEGPG